MWMMPLCTVNPGDAAPIWDGSLRAWVEMWLAMVHLGVNVVAVLIIVVGVAGAAMTGVRSGGRAMRRSLGVHLLLALELLVAADIIETILAPGLEQVASLVGVAAVRTLLAHTLSKELREA